MTQIPDSMIDASGLDPAQRETLAAFADNLAQGDRMAVLIMNLISEFAWP